MLPGKRHGIHKCRSDTGNCIRSARTAGGKRYANLSGGTRISVGSMCGALLMACQYVMNIVGIIVQGIVQRHDLSAGIAENSIYALLLQTFQYYI